MTSGSQNGRLRPLSVQEALQYSPFTTSTTAGHGMALFWKYLARLSTDLLNSDRIPVPQVGLASSSSSLTTSAERKAIRRSLEEISRNSMKHQNGPKSLQDVRHSVEMLLDGEALPELYAVHLLQDPEAQKPDLYSSLIVANSRHPNSATSLCLPRPILRPNSSQSSVRSQVWFWTRPMLHTNVCCTVEWNWGSLR